MVFINITDAGKLSVHLELPQVSASFIAEDESFIEEIMQFISASREEQKSANQDNDDLSITELDLRDKLSLPIIVSKDSEVEGRYLLQIKLAEESFFTHPLTVDDLEALLVAFKDAQIQLG